MTIECTETEARTLLTTIDHVLKTFDKKPDEVDPALAGVAGMMVETLGDIAHRIESQFAPNALLPTQSIQLMTATTTRQFTLNDVLSDDRINAFSYRPADDLRAYQGIILVKIAEVEHHMSSQNLYKKERAILADDLRIYIGIREKLAGILTKEFHVR